MTECELKDLACELSALSVFRGVLDTPPMTAFLNFLVCDGSTQKKADLFGKFVYSLSADQYCFSKFLCRAVYTDENAYIVGAAQNAELPSVLLENSKAELRLFSKLSRLSSSDLSTSLNFKGYLPRFENGAVDFEKTYAERLRHVAQYGYGIFASARMFCLEGEKFLPLKASDKITLNDFIGYERQRQQVLNNTQALMEGRPAANMLLFGDAGTGKSSTIKACANHFSKDGLRLIELRKNQLLDLPRVTEQIGNNPLKFILFIDDLSFSKNDDGFGMLKAALEGSASAKAKNTVIYATSNRRHIVKESFSNREDADDIHRNDTIQELMSLSDRFGATVYFEKPNKALYLDIVHQLADKKGVAMEKSELFGKAEAFALKKGCRSPRAAEQFINSLL